MVEREEYWQELSRGWESSGESQKEYCRREGVSLSQFRWWRCELKRRKNKQLSVRQASNGGFVRVHLKDPETPKGQNGTVEVVLNNGLRIAFYDQDGVPASLASLVMTLESM